MFDGDDCSEGGPRGTFETYKAEGDALFKNGEFKKAIEIYSTALELRQDDQDCLVARSMCYLQLGDTQKALLDAETSLKGEPNFHKGLYQKAEALYCKGEFELALMFYHRGYKLRPELQKFRLGIQKAQEAISNSVGSPEKVRLTKEGDLSFFNQLTEPAKKGRKTGYQRSTTHNRVRSSAVNNFKSVSSDKTVKQLLGELYGDRVYLEKLLKETDQTSPTGKNIYDLVCDGIRYLDTRTEFWRQQKPMYARKRVTQPKNRVAPSSTVDPQQYILKEMVTIDDEQNEGKHPESLKRAKKCLKTLENYSDSSLRNKNELVANLHSCIGNAHMEMGQIDQALHHHNLDMQIADSNNLPDARSRALDNLGRVHARAGHYDKAIEIWNKKLPLCSVPLEKAWLYHEVGRCYLEIGRHDVAQDYGEKSSAAARDADDSTWQLNATVLIAQAEVKQNQLQAALGSFEKALNMAELQGDRSAQTAIKKAMEDINHRIVLNLKSHKKDEGPEEDSSAEQEKHDSSTPASPEPESQKEATEQPPAENEPSPNPDD